MARNSGDFDDDEGFFESLMRRKDSVPMPESMAKMFKVIVGGGVLLVVALITWAVWPNGGKQSDENVPIVRAETTDYKVEPDDKGGMIIPNKDSTIFETMDRDSKPEKKVESLLEDSEQPMKKAEAFVGANSAPSEEPLDPPVSVAETPKAETIVADEVKAEPAPVVKAESKPEVKAEAVKAVAKEEVKAPVKEVAKAPEVKAEAKKVNIIDALKQEAGTAKKADTAKATAAPKGNVYIQLAAVKTEADAKTKWANLKAKYSSLASLSLKVQKADLGAKGTFYRVQAGPTSADNATSVCAKIKAAKGDCLIAK